MEEDISAINTSTRNERIKNFFINNKKRIIILLSILILLIISYFAFDEIKKRNELKIANQYNNSKINFFSGKKSNVEKEMIEIVQAKDKTYSPLALYFLVDNKIVNSNEKINNLFDNVIDNKRLDKEIRNLIIYKKALYNADFETENKLLKILNPIINSFSMSILLFSVHRPDFLSNEQFVINKKINNNPKILFTEISLNSFLSL